MNCPTCGSNKSRKALVKKGKKKLFPQLNLDERQCTQCGRTWSIYGRNPKLLYFDIELSHTIYSLWGCGKQYVSSKRIKKDWIVLSYAAKWVCTDSLFSKVMRPREIKNWDDKRLVKGLWDLFNQADIIIGHNLNGFDIKKMNWRFEMCGLGVTTPYRVVDTLTIARRVFGSPADLNYLAKRFDLNGGKNPMCEDDWDRCEAGDPEALRKMREYNENDVIIGEGVYLRLRKWDKYHPNMGLYYETNKARCKNCGSWDLDIDYNNTVTTSANTWACWTCKNCGACGRSPYSTRYEGPCPDEDKEDRKERARNNRIKRESLMR